MAVVSLANAYPLRHRVGKPMKTGFRLIVVLWCAVGLRMGSVAAGGLSVFMTLDGFTGTLDSQTGAYHFKGPGGYDVALETRDGRSRLGLRFGRKEVELEWRGDIWYGQASWLANKPLEWRGVRGGAGFEPRALIFRAWRENLEPGKRAIEAFVVVGLRGCDSEILGVVPVEDGPLLAVQLADRLGVEGGGEGRLASSKRLLVEQLVDDWSSCRLSQDEGKLRMLYHPSFLAVGGKRKGTTGTEWFKKAVLDRSLVEGRIARKFEIREEGGGYDVSFQMFAGKVELGNASPLRVRMRLASDSGGLKILSEVMETEGGEVVTENRSVAGDAVSRQVSTDSMSKVGEKRGGGDLEIGQVMVGKWMASDGKRITMMVFEEGGQVKVSQAALKGRPAGEQNGTWREESGRLVLDVGNGPETYAVSPAKSGRYRLTGRSGMIYLQKQR
jgi:hypothetical protein